MIIYCCSVKLYVFSGGGKMDFQSEGLVGGVYFLGKILLLASPPIQGITKNPDKRAKSFQSVHESCNYELGKLFSSCQHNMLRSLCQEECGRLFRRKSLQPYKDNSFSRHIQSSFSRHCRKRTASSRYRQFFCFPKVSPYRSFHCTMKPEISIQTILSTSVASGIILPVTSQATHDFPKHALWSCKFADSSIKKLDLSFPTWTRLFSTRRDDTWCQKCFGQVYWLPVEYNQASYAIYFLP